MELIVLFILILVNAFFAATEMAFVSLNDAKIEKMAKEGKAGACTAYDIPIGYLSPLSAEDLRKNLL